MAIKPKKRNPQDATLRNIRALKKRVVLLLKVAADHSLRLGKLEGKR